MLWNVSFLVDGSSKTDVGEQSQGIADVADGKLFHGRFSFLLLYFVLVTTSIFI